MALVSLLEVHHALGLAPLLDGAALAIERGERIGLIGRNGTGKSTLLRIVAGEIQPDRGTLAIQNGLRVGYVPQEPQFDPALSAAEVVASGLPSAAEISAYEAALHALGEDDSPAALERLHRAQAALEAAGGWNHAHRVEAMLGKLGIDGSQRLGAMSGGQKRRVALAHALAAQPELLLLDEPTNHLDITAIRWLESLLVDLGCALLFVTHDRAFLDAVATRIVELDRGHLRSYPGNFSAYEVLKAQQLDAERLERERFDKLLSQEEVWIRKGVEARRTRSVARIERLVQMRGEREARRNAVGRAQMKVDAGGQSGRLVIEALGVSKTMGDRTVVRDLDLTVMRGDKLALLGDNGSGKTTLLRLMLGELAPDSGSLRRGTQLDVAYFDQLRAALDPDRTVRETISPGSDWIEVNGTRKHVMSYLGDFLFPPARANSPVRSLSGGERNRLLLARLFARPANLLVLAYFKYANFFLGSLNHLTGAALTLGEIILPLGISFFTFTQIAFLADVYFGKVREYNFVHYSLFVTYFPHLIAGPVLHHAEMMPQFRRAETYRFSFENAAVGLTIFAIGLFKKVMLADPMGVYARPVFDAASSGVTLTALEAWGGALAYTFQLYFDFSGYSDMAIGVGVERGAIGIGPAVGECQADPSRHRHMVRGQVIDPELVLYLDCLADENGWSHALQLLPRRQPRQLLFDDQFQAVDGTLDFGRGQVTDGAAAGIFDLTVGKLDDDTVRS